METPFFVFLEVGLFLAAAIGLFAKTRYLLIYGSNARRQTRKHAADAAKNASKISKKKNKGFEKFPCAFSCLEHAYHVNIRPTKPEI